MSIKSKLIFFLITTVFFVTCDEYISSVLLNYAEKNLTNTLFDIVFVPNLGAAFNLFEGSKVFLITFAFIAIVFLLYSIYKNIKQISTMGLFFFSMLIAGIFSNMYERIVFGFVRDYIKLKFINFPVFNISDIFINIGVLAIVFLILKNNYSKNNEVSSR